MWFYFVDTRDSTFHDVTPGSSPRQSRRAEFHDDGSDDEDDGQTSAPHRLEPYMDR